MLRTERWEENANAVIAAIDGRQSHMWTAIPGIVQSFNAEHNTVEVQPTIQRKLRQPDGTSIDETLSLCVDVPVHFPSGGGFTMTVPVQRGDECLLVFSSRCIDNWWDRGGVQPQRIERMHNPSDGFAILGTRSKPRALKNVSTSNVQLRSDDGSVFIEIQNGQQSGAASQAGGNQVVRIVAPTKVRLETPLLEVTGDIHAGGEVQAHALVSATPAPSVGFGDPDPLAAPKPVSLSTHLHSGVQPGGAMTQPPVPGT